MDIGESTRLEASTENENDINTLKTQTQSNELSSIIEVVKSTEEISKEFENELEDINQDNYSKHLELTEETTIDEIVPTIENKKDILDLINKNENDITEQVDDAIISKVVDNVNTNLNISEEIKILDDAVKNSIQLDNSTTEKYLQLNGDILPANHESPGHNFHGIIENHIVSNGDDTVLKYIEIQNSFNTLLSQDLEVSITEKEDTQIPVIIDSGSNESVKEKINGNVENPDSISNSSDSETIVNSECLQHKVNGDNVENNSEKNVVAQPISVITVQTCDTVDSDCSEAYLTPNELNDTPKKILEKINMNVNDHTNIVNDDVKSQFNPSIESNNKVEIPSKNTSETIIEQIEEGNFEKIEVPDIKVEENVNKLEENVNKVEENVIKVEENVLKVDETVLKVEEAVNITQENVNKVEENIVKIKENVDHINETVHNIDGDVDKKTEHVNKVEEIEVNIENNKIIKMSIGTENKSNEDMKNETGMIIYYYVL